MPKFTIKTEKFAGFAAENGRPGETITVITKHRGYSSDPRFELFLNHIGRTYLSKIKFPVSSIVKCLILLHNDDNADIYVNDFEEKLTVKLKKEVGNIVAGQSIHKEHIQNIESINFPDIEIKEEDAIIYLSRSGWLFSLFFDFTRKLNLDDLFKDLAQFKNLVEFRSLENEIKSYEELIKLTDSLGIGGEPEKRPLGSSEKAIKPSNIITEGKTDVKHLVKAKEKLQIKDEIIITSREEGATDLLKHLLNLAEDTSSRRLVKLIGIFDGDDEKSTKDLKDKGINRGEIKLLGNNVYAFLLPTPSHRNENIKNCIEMFYEDRDLLRKDKNGKRIYLSSEFTKNGKLKSDPTVHTNMLNQIKDNDKDNTLISIISEKVFGGSDTLIALSKNEFADCISNEDENFRSINFSEFKKIFDVLEETLK